MSKRTYLVTLIIETDLYKNDEPGISSYIVDLLESEDGGDTGVEVKVTSNGEPIISIIDITK